MTRKPLLKTLLAAAALAVCAAPATASASLSAAQKKAIEKAGANAYTYGYAPVYMQRNVSRFPAGRVINVQYLATDLTRSIVKPNADSLYTIMVLDVGTDPVIVTTPPTGSRYFGLELLDGYTNVFGYIGNRATGNAGGKYAIVGPNWNPATKPLPSGVASVLHSGTPRVWVIGRTLVDNQADVANAVAIQNGISAEQGGTALPNFNLSAPSATGSPVSMTPTAAFFKEFGSVTAAQPPLAADAGLIARLAKYGVGPGLDPSASSTPASKAVLAELVKGAVTAQKAIDAGVTKQRKASVKKRNGWILFKGVGTYGTDYLTRAIIADFGLGANRPEEAVYPAALTDYKGKSLNGAGNSVYKIHFNKGQTPPNNAFWSITMYGQDQFFIANPLGRFAIGDRTPGTVKNADGSLDIIVSAKQPSAALHGAANWLPSPAAQFSLMMRIYLPTTAVLNDTWKYPKITKVA